MVGIYSCGVETAAERAAGSVTEKFSASGGRWVGVAAVIMGAVIVVGAAMDSLDDSWRMAALGVALALLAWAVMIRPRIAAHEHGLLMRNVLRDVLVPWGSIERCKALQTFQVATPEGVFHGLGVSRSARSVMRQQVGGRSVLGTMFGQRLGSVEPSSGYAREEVHTSLSYLDFIEARIASMAQESTDEPRPVVRSVAVLPVAALVGAALLLMAAIVG